MIAYFIIEYAVLCLGPPAKKIWGGKASNKIIVRRTHARATRHTQVDALLDVARESHRVAGNDVFRLHLYPPGRSPHGVEAEVVPCEVQHHRETTQQGSQRRLLLASGRSGILRLLLLPPSCR